MLLPQAVILKEVGPRDGLQNESRILSVEEKIELVNRLTQAGFRYIEVTSFVHPRWIPALADAEDVLRGIERRPGVQYSALVPNERGLERALAAQVDAVNVFMSASETHNRKNINKSLAATYPVIRPVVAAAKAAGLPVRGYVSTAFGCPYEGCVPTAQVVDICARLLDMGVDELSLGDTIGVAVPAQVAPMVASVRKIVKVERIALHFHDTYGMAIANIAAGMEAGVTVFDAAVGGLGGCPYAPGAAGNVATEDALYLLHRSGVQTGIDESLLDAAGAWLEGVLDKRLPSHLRQVARSGRGSE